MERLPNELLSIIYVSAIENFHDASDLTISPTTISHVCRRWRQVALSTGTLWSTIVLTFPSSADQLARTVTWLARSKTYPLDILLDFRDPAWDWEENSHGFCWKDMETVLHILMPHVARWRSFELLTDTWAPIFTFLWHTRSTESAPMLETLRLSRCNEYFASKGEVFQPASLRHHLPLLGGGSLENLREVILTGVHVDWSSCALANLMKLELKYHASNVMPTLDQFVKILESCPDLQDLSIIGWGPQFDPALGAGASTSAQAVLSPDLSAMQGAIKLPRVSHLAFGFVDVYYAVKLLSLFYLPSLEELSLEDVSASLHLPNPDDATFLLNWLVAIQSPAEPQSDESSSSTFIPLSQIQTLELKGLQARLSTFGHFFGQCTTLRTLSISDANDDALRALDSPNAAPDPAGSDVAPALPCPHLQKISGRSVDAVLFARVVAERPQLSQVAFEEAAELIYNQNDSDET